MSGGTKSLCPLHSGCPTEGAWIGTEGRGRQGARGGGGMRAAEARAVADGEDLAQAGAAFAVGPRFHRATAARYEAMRAAQRTRQFRRRGEAVVQRHDIGVEGEV